MDNERNSITGVPYFFRADVVLVSGYHPIQQSPFGNSLQKFITFRAAQFKHFITLRNYLYIHCFGTHTTGILACSGECSLQFRLLGISSVITLKSENRRASRVLRLQPDAHQFRQRQPILSASGQPTSRRRHADACSAGDAATQPPRLTREVFSKQIRPPVP